MRSFLLFLLCLSPIVQAGVWFDKIGQDGQVLPDDAQKWLCVQDKKTKLIWEVKTVDASSPHFWDKKYRWGGETVDKSAIAMDGVNMGEKSEYSLEGDYFSDWNSLIEHSNQEQLCGKNNWRIPSIEELEGIKNQTKSSSVNGSGPYIDGHYFPHVNFGYWSSTAVSNYENYAWGIFYSYGRSEGKYRGDMMHVMLVSD